MLIKLATILVSLSGVGVGDSTQKRKQAVMTLLSTEACISSYVYKQVAFTKYLFNFVYLYSHLVYLYVYHMHADAVIGHKGELNLWNWSYRRYLS